MSHEKFVIVIITNAQAFFLSCINIGTICGFRNLVKAGYVALKANTLTVYNSFKYKKRNNGRKHHTAMRRW